MSLKKEDIEYIKDMVGQRVLVVSSKEASWEGEVIEVVDQETLLIRPKSTADLRKVNIFHIRSKER